MIMLGTSIAADEAHINGLVADVFDDGTVLEKTLAVAERLSNSSGVALSFAKEAICGGESSYTPFSNLSRGSACLSRRPRSQATSMASCRGSISLTIYVFAVAVSIADDLGQNEELERRLYYTSFGTADKREGISAFLQKRKPRWFRASRRNVAPPHKVPVVAAPKKNSGYPLRPLVMLPRTIGRAALGKEIAPIPIAV